MKHYVAGFMKDAAGNVALVRKNKPKWQEGRLNGIGGGIESGEGPYEAMCREWKEETGHSHPFWYKFAEIRFPETVVHFFKAKVDKLPAFPANNDIGEAIEVWRIDLAARLSSHSIISNLKWLLPMAFEDPDAKFALLTPIAANDNDCLTAPNGDCITPGPCIHTPLNDAVGRGDILLPVAA